MLLFILMATDMPIGQDASGVGRAVTIRAEDIILILVSSGWLLNRAKTKSLGIIKYLPIYRPILIMALIIIVATIVGYFQGTVSASKGFFFSMKRLEYFWIFFMAFNLMETDKEAKKALWILLGTSVVIALVGLTRFFFFPVTMLDSGGVTGMAGFGRANTMGDFLLLMLSVNICLLIFVDQKRQYFLYLGSLIIFFFSFLMTKSRGAYVSFPPVLVVLAGVTMSRKLIVLIISSVFILVVYIFIVFFSSGDVSKLISKHDEDISGQFKEIADVAKDGLDSDPSMHSRMNSWRVSMDQIIQYPLLGQGCGAKKLGYSDCQHVRELLETGMLGYTAFMYMNISIFLFLLKVYRRTGKTILKALSVGFMGGIVGMMFHGVTMSNYYTIFNMEVFWFLLAIVCLFWYNEQKQNADFVKEPKAHG
jgi:uncharacterized membrane protein